MHYYFPFSQRVVLCGKVGKKYFMNIAIVLIFYLVAPIHVGPSTKIDRSRDHPSYSSTGFVVRLLEMLNKHGTKNVIFGVL